MAMWLYSHGMVWLYMTIWPSHAMLPSVLAVKVVSGRVRQGNKVTTMMVIKRKSILYCNLQYKMPFLFIIIIIAIIIIIISSWHDLSLSLVTLSSCHFLTNHSSWRCHAAPCHDAQNIKRTRPLTTLTASTDGSIACETHQQSTWPLAAAGVD